MRPGISWIDLEKRGIMKHISYKKTRFITTVFILFLITNTYNLPTLGSTDTTEDQTIQTAPEADDEQTSPDPQTDPEELPQKKSPIQRSRLNLRMRES
jgi:hypothetical protein